MEINFAGQKYSGEAQLIEFRYRNMLKSWTFKAVNSGVDAVMKL